MFDVTFLTSNWTLHLRRRLPGRADRGRRRAGAGLLQLRRPLHRQGRPQAGRGAAPSGSRPTSGSSRPRPRRWAAPIHEERGRRPVDPARRRRVHLPQPARLPDGAGLRVAPGRARRRGESYLDWKPEVCWQLPLRLDDHTDDNGHVTSIAARVEAAGLGRGRRRLPLVVHRDARGLRRPRARVPRRCARRDRRARRRVGLRRAGPTRPSRREAARPTHGRERLLPASRAQPRRLDQADDRSAAMRSLHRRQSYQRASDGGRHDLPRVRARAARRRDRRRAST